MTCPCEMTGLTTEALEELHRKQSLEWVRGLGNPPRGFYESDGGFDCNATSPAYVRGILMPTPYYDSLSFDEKFALQDPNVHPRWRLYGGPFLLKQDADAWDNYLFFYAFNSNQTWISHATACIVPSSVIAWPADSEIRWDWVYETKKSDRAQKVWNPQTGRYDLKWV